jgi:hypothetical protein
MKRLVLFISLIAGMGTALFAQNAALPRLAVVEFTINVNTEKAKADAITVRNQVESRMAETRKYRMMTRNEIDQLLANQRIQVSSISSAENRKKLELEQISYIITGSLDAMGNDYAVTVRVLDVSNGEYPTIKDDLMGSGPRELRNGVNSLMAEFITEMTRSGVGGTYKIGDRGPAGGIVFYDKGFITDGWRYLEAVPAGAEFKALWGPYVTSVPKPRENGEPDISLGAAGSGTHIIKIGGVFDTPPPPPPPPPPSYSPFTPQWSDWSDEYFYDEPYFDDPYSDEYYVLPITPVTSEVIGSGKQNTQSIVEYLNLIRWGNCAAQICAAMDINGYKDWFLPSKDELDLMYKNLKLKGLGGFSNNWYWSSSSSLYNNEGVWIQDFSDGEQLLYNNNTFTTSVRAVRSF